MNTICFAIGNVPVEIVDGIMVKVNGNVIDLKELEESILKGIS